jgi:hypothetical protein
MKQDYQTLIDEMLQRIASHEKTRAQQAGVPTQDIPTVQDLRQSWLGQHLTQLAGIAESGLITMNKSEARTALEDVYAMLFMGPVDTYPRIPAFFSEAPLGQMLNRARARTLDLEEVVNVSEAAKIHGVSRAQIYLLIDTGLLHPIEMNGRLMIERRELEHLRETKEKERN